jgi:hypothetical protein
VTLLVVVLLVHGVVNLGLAIGVLLTVAKVRTNTAARLDHADEDGDGYVVRTEKPFEA